MTPNRACHDATCLYRKCLDNQGRQSVYAWNVLVPRKGCCFPSWCVWISVSSVAVARVDDRVGDAGPLDVRGASDVRVVRVPPGSNIPFECNAALGVAAGDVVALVAASRSEQQRPREEIALLIPLKTHETGSGASGRTRMSRSTHCASVSRSTIAGRWARWRRGETRCGDRDRQRRRDLEGAMARVSSPPPSRSRARLRHRRAVVPTAPRELTLPLTSCSKAR